MKALLALLALSSGLFLALPHARQFTKAQTAVNSTNGSVQNLSQSVNSSPESGINPTPQLAFHHVTVSVENVDATAQWYVEKLGFTLERQFTLNNGEVEIAWLRVPGMRLDLAQVKGSQRSAEQRTVPPEHMLVQGWRHVVLTVDDIDEAYQTLTARGVEFIQEPRNYNPPGIRIAYFKDPEGNILELYSDLPQP